MLVLSFFFFFFVSPNPRTHGGDNDKEGEEDRDGVRARGIVFFFRFSSWLAGECISFLGVDAPFLFSLIEFFGGRGAILGVGKFGGLYLEERIFGGLAIGMWNTISIF